MERVSYLIDLLRYDSHFTHYTNVRLPNFNNGTHANLQLFKEEIHKCIISWKRDELVDKIIRYEIEFAQLSQYHPDFIAINTILDEVSFIYDKLRTYQSIYVELAQAINVVEKMK